MAAYHSCLRKTARWYHKVAIDILLGTAVTNALHLYNERHVAAGKKTMKIAAFRENVTLFLLHNGADNTSECTQGATPTADMRRNAEVPLHHLRIAE